MIKIMKHRYLNKTHDLTDIISDYDYIENIEVFAKENDMSTAGLGRNIRRLKDLGLLVSHRYPNNNMIWAIGDDIDYNSWECYQIAKYRAFADAGGNTDELDKANDDEQENMLIDIPVFVNEKREAFEDNGYAYLEKSKKIINAGIEVSEEFKIEVDKMWSKYRAFKREENTNGII